MKILLKKDIKALLPGFAMFVTTGIALLLISLFAVFSGNGDFTVTALYLIIYCLVIAIAYVIIKGCMHFRNNLCSDKYINDICEKGLNYKTFLVNKILMTMLQNVFLMIEYLLAFVIVIAIADKKLPKVAKEISNREFSDRLTDAFGHTGILAGLGMLLEGILLVGMITALIYLAFGLCYTYFIRGKYAVAASLMTSFSMLWVFWKIFDFIVPKKGAGSVYGTIVFSLIGIFVFMIMNIQIVLKKRINL